jgi:hypothetical protein
MTDIKYNSFTGEAIKNLAPEATCTVFTDRIDWADTDSSKIPSESAIKAEQDRLQAVWENNEYQRKRAKEYPDPRLYLDAVVKGDQEAIQAYIDDCLAVKAKYPKPE